MLLSYLLNVFTCSLFLLSSFFMYYFPLLLPHSPLNLYLYFFPLFCIFPFSVPHSSSLLFLFFPLPQPCVAVLQGILCCPQPLSAVLRVLLLWLHLFLSSSTTTTTLYYPPLPTSWQVHTLCTTCLPACCLPAWISRLHRLKLCLLPCLWIFLFSCLFVITGSTVFIRSINSHWPHSQFNCNLANLKSCWSAVRKICMLQV